MPDDVPEAVKRERLERLTELQRAITADRYEARIARRATLLVDRAAEAGEPAQARAPWQADDVDGVTWLDTDAAPGSFVEAVIDEVVDDYDFAATAVRVLDAPTPAPPTRTSRALPVAAVTIGSWGR
jgi:ribosomal protein S12 methylthiotransferase